MFEGTGALDIIKESLNQDKITPEEAFSLCNVIRIDTREQRILQWGKYYFADKFSSEFCDLHEYLASIRKEQFTATFAPRGHAKTTILCFLIPIYQALVEPETYKHYIQVQSTATKAISVNIAIRHEIETNELLRRDYGDQVASEKWTEKQFVLKNGIIFSAISAEESMRGVNYNNIRPDFFMVDDLFDEEDIRNMDSTNKKVDWFFSSLFPSKVLMSDMWCFHVTGTAINKNDLIHKLSKSKEVIFKKFKAIIDFDKKLTLWKSFDKLMKEKDIICLGSSSIFLREYQNECRSDEDSIIKEHWIKFYDGVIPEDETVIETFLGVDPAIGIKTTNDPTGKALMNKTKNANYYIHGVRNSRLTFDQNIKDIEVIHKRFPLSNKGCRLEAISAFQAFGQELKRKTSVPVEMITSVKDKLTRLENQSGKFENGKVFINNNIPLKLKNELIEQLTNNDPTHDDIRDAVIIVLEEDAGKKGLRMAML